MFDAIGESPNRSNERDAPSGRDYYRRVRRHAKDRSAVRQRQKLAIVNWVVMWVNGKLNRPDAFADDWGGVLLVSRDHRIRAQRDSPGAIADKNASRSANVRRQAACADFCKEHFRIAAWQVNGTAGGNDMSRFMHSRVRQKHEVGPIHGQEVATHDVVELPAGDGIVGRQVNNTDWIAPGSGNPTPISRPRLRKANVGAADQENARSIKGHNE